MATPFHPADSSSPRTSLATRESGGVTSSPTSGISDMSKQERSLVSCEKNSSQHPVLHLCGYRVSPSIRLICVGLPVTRELYYSSGPLSLQEASWEVEVYLIAPFHNVSLIFLLFSSSCRQDHQGKATLPAPNLPMPCPQCLDSEKNYFPWESPAAHTCAKFSPQRRACWGISESLGKGQSSKMKTQQSQRMMPREGA